MRQDGAETVISMGEIALQREGALEGCYRLQMLEVLRSPPHQNSAGYVSFRQIRLYLKRTLAVECSSFQPHAGGVEFVMSSRTRKRQGGMLEGKNRISTHGIGQVMDRLLHPGGITRGAEPVA